MNLFSKLSAAVSLTRIINVLITFVSVLVAVLICSSSSAILAGTILLAAVTASIVTACGNIINDVFDYETDLVNKPNRPLPSGNISKSSAVVFYFVLLIISLIVSCLISWIIFTIVLLSQLLLLLYSLSLKKIPLLGNVVISFLTGFVFIYGGIIAGNINVALIPALFAFLINLSREGIKTIEDIPGDKKTGFKSFPQIFGIKFSQNLIAAFLILLLLFTFVPFLTGFYSIEYFILVMVIVNPLLVYVIKTLLENNQSVNLNKLSFILKLNMIFGLIAIYFGR
jgi:geranylgeranylglycerol-phosphate geranylgeranyltransferase